MECKRLPVDYEIRNFSPKIILLNQKFWFDNFFKTAKNLPNGQVVLKVILPQIFNLINTFPIFINSIPVYGSTNCEFS